MAELLRMPEVAAGAAEAVLQSWNLGENVAFAAGDVIATVETEKAVVEVEADRPGAVLKVLVAAGSAVEVGVPIAVVGEPGERVDDAVLAGLGLTAPPPTSVPVRRDVPDPPRIFTSPLARRLAREAGIPLEEIRGTGPNGRIVRKDVTEAAARRSERPVGHVDVPHSRIRRVTAARLTESKREAPHFYLRGTARVDALLTLRSQLDIKVSLNDLVLKAAARAHTLVPDMNVTWAQEAVRRYSTVDLAVAVATPQGLLTPVLRGVDGMTVGAVSAAVQDFAARARAGTLRQEELQGGTLTVTNLGMYGTEEFAAIINPPHAAIMAVGAARQEPVVVDGEVRVATVMRVTLSVDHRPVDGVVAAEWMRAFVATVENPVRMLA
ncbi:2-oxo acid dehydrogenase subunit E2 [Nonomuraea sp. NPDC050556]|uniref:2-oxo acid dehydrogenase subunit E2 n=1 Tax=Nonomuraea sp. NPDC050556 TaxID=3364369 RepID=UPI0037995851